MGKCIRNLVYKYFVLIATIATTTAEVDNETQNEQKQENKD